jgi:hypothetical protein
MPFVKDLAVAEEVGNVFGEYDSTFTSDTGQIRAELFRRGGTMIAYVSFAPGWNAQNATDKYLAQLQRHADDAGFPGKLRITFAEN